MSQTYIMEGDSSHPLSYFVTRSRYFCETLLSLAKNISKEAALISQYNVTEKVDDLRVKRSLILESCGIVLHKQYFYAKYEVIFSYVCFKSYGRRLLALLHHNKLRMKRPRKRFLYESGIFDRSQIPMWKYNIVAAFRGMHL